VMMLDDSPSLGNQNPSTPAQNCPPNTLQQALLKRIKKLQLKKSRPFRFPGQYETIQGLFISYPTYTLSLLKKYLKKSFHIRVPDNNAFVTFWTLELLLEAFERDTEDLDTIRMKDSVMALMQFHDQTREQDDPLFVFWRQHRAGEYPVVFPSNLMPFYRLFMHFNTVVNNAKGALQKIRPVKKSSGGHPSHEPKRSSAAFSLPADFDDAALNWSLGSCLSGARDACPDAWDTWSQNSFDFKKLAQHALTCAYRPFSDDPDANSIDPRSFYAIRTFLWDLQDSGRDVRNFSLLTTWASTVSNNIEGIHRYYKMPFNVNNLDCSVQANFIHAACKSASNGTFPHEVKHFDDLVIDTAQYVAWALASNTIIQQPDIALLYYPTPACAFLFISRIVQLVHNTRVHEQAAKLFEKIEAALMPSAREHITDYLLSGAVQTDTTAFWQRLPVEQATAPGSSRLDDRKFLTAASVTCLLNLWTQRREEGLEWLPSVPGAVPVLAGKGLAWLRHYGLSCSDHNAFFSASVKHARSLPFLFPANRKEHSTGPALQPNISKQSPKMTRHSVYAMSGVPSREKYARMLKEKGLNAVEDGAFQKCFELDYPYWSAPTVTSALVNLALSKASALRL